MAHTTLQRSVTQNGWNLFERWARNFERGCLRRDKTPVLLTYNEVMSVAGINCNLDLNEADAIPQADKAERIRDQVGFLRAYLVEISFDQGPFDVWVKRLLANHNNRDWKKGYSFIFFKNDIENVPSGASWHFNGFNTNLFCERIDDIDFASVMHILPFDFMAIRNKAARNWSDAEIQSVIAEIEQDLRFDGLEAGLKQFALFDPFLFLYASDPWWSKSKAKRRRINSISKKKEKSQTFKKSKK